MLEKKQYLRSIHADWFVLSAGGNDLQEALAAGCLIVRYDPAVPIEECWSASGLELFKKIASG